MIRIPDAGRFELRLMDGSVNPYLLQAGILAAGNDGMDKKRDPGKPLLINMYTEYKDYPNLKKRTKPLTIFIPGPFGLRKYPRAAYNQDFDTEKD